MFTKLEILPLNDPQKIWLKEAVDLFIEGKPISRLMVKLKLLDIIEKNFDPNSIDARLVKFAYQPTLYGIWHIYKENEIFIFLDKLIKVIRTKIIINPFLDKMCSNEIFAEIDCDSKMIIVLFRLLYNIGGFCDNFSYSDA